MQRYLPPLLLLVVLGTVAVRCALEPSRPVGRELIGGLVQGRQFAQADRHLRRYLARFDDPEDHWFAARMYFRMARPRDGIDTIWRHPTIPDAPGTARRFAEMGLFALGWDDEERREPTALEPRALVILVEGGNAWAEERIRRHAAEYDLTSTTSFFFPAYRLATQRPMGVITPVFRSRGEEVFDVAAALGALHAEDYPDKDRDISRLVEVVESVHWRQQYLPVWTVACLALGRSGDARALEALERVEARLEGSTRQRDREDLLLLRNGLIAAGVWRVDEAVAANALGEEPRLMATMWYLEALIHRYRQGDVRSELRLTQMWEGPGDRFPDIRHRIARAHLLQDDPPTQEAIETWVDRMLRELQADGAPLMSHVLARAYRLRSGEAAARAGLIEALREAGAAFEGRSRDVGGLANPFVEALRALYLYG